MEGCFFQISGQPGRAAFQHHMTHVYFLQAQQASCSHKRITFFADTAGFSYANSPGSPSPTRSTGPRVQGCKGPGVQLSKSPKVQGGPSVQGSKVGKGPRVQKCKGTRVHTFGPLDPWSVVETASPVSLHKRILLCQAALGHRDSLVSGNGYFPWPLLVYFLLVL